MRLGVVGWCTDSGVGREFQDALRHLPVQAAFVLQNSAKPTRKNLLSAVPHLEWDGREDVAQMVSWITRFNVDTILTWEIPGSWNWPAIWKGFGIRWYHVVHADWFDASRMDAWRYARLLAPNGLCQRMLAKYGLPSKLLRVPIDVDAIPFRPRTSVSSFVTLYGYGGHMDRRGIGVLCEAWRQMNGASLVVRAQQLDGLMDLQTIPGVRLMLGTEPNHADLYLHGDVAVQPSRYEGIGVSFLEAQAAGIPVITANAEPMNEIAPDLLVPLRSQQTLDIMGNQVLSSEAYPSALAAKAKSILNADISMFSRLARERAEAYSWNRWKQNWIDTLSAP